MPFIDCKITSSLTEAQKETLKTQFGQSISIIHKTESYLMVGISDNYTLYFQGKKLENGAYIGVKAFGALTPSLCDKMTATICKILKDELGIDGKNVYVTYQGISDWGWNGGNF